MGRIYIFILLTFGLLASVASEIVLPPHLLPTRESKVLPPPAPPSALESGIEYDEAEELEDPAAIEESDENYASEFPYGQPLEKFQMEERMDRAQSRQGRTHIRIINKIPVKPRNYAKKYRTWTPSKEYVKPVKYRKGPKRLGPPTKRRPGHRRESMPPHRRRKVRPVRGNHLRKPTPPPEPDYDYFNDEEYFPEESKRNEYASHERRPPQKAHKPRRKPAVPGKGHRQREDYPVPVKDHRHHEDYPVPVKDHRHHEDYPSVPAKDHRHHEDYPSVSYSNFVQHAQPTVASYDYAEAPEDEYAQYYKKERKRKKKRKKSDRHRNRDHGEDQFGANSESVEEAVQNYEKYPPYHYDQPVAAVNPQRFQHPTTTVAPIYGDGYLGQQQNRVPQNVNINRGSTGGLGNYENGANSQAPQTFANQHYQATNYNNFGVSNNNPQPDIITQQNYNQFVNQGYTNNRHSPQQTYNQNYNRQTAENNRPSSVPQQATNGHTLHNIIPTNRGNEYSSKYKSSSFFDNTETFQDFNQNVNFQQKRQTNFVPSTEYQEPEDRDNAFINRHLDLYSNGMTGVPVQGGGDSRTKDYDIGYGEIQYDETHRTKK